MIANFYKQPSGLAAVCATHNHVLHSEPGSASAETETVRLLAAEIAQRTRLEQALRGALDEVRRSNRVSR
ncbi:MAG: hypothetical protein ACJ790_08810 [Myxococcaceae bacterium]